jgi:hypothetical protein
MKTMPSRRITAGVLATALVAAAGPALAAEGASSHYLPGMAGDILIAVPPKPGFAAGATLWYQSGEVGAAVLQGRVDLGLDLDLTLGLAAGSYTVENPWLGGTYTAAVLIPFGQAELDATTTGPLGNTFATSGSRFDLSDVAFVPVQLNWQVGEFSFKAAQAVIAPTGGYSTGRAINLGRNYWSFDTQAAVTWFHQATGTEISLAPGIMFNTKNNATDYKTGTEFHLDFVANQFLSPNFAIGLRGYWYQQVTDDSGSGAQLGDFKSSSFGIGPGFFWAPAFADGRLVVLGKWLHDLEATNRFESDYGIVTLGWQF